MDRFSKFFMACAFEASKLSYATRKQVGAILTREKRIIATGYNGQPYNFDNVCEYINENGLLNTKNTVVHAELNVLLFCARHGISTNNTALYITLSPCVNCATAIIQAGISKLYYGELYRDISGINLLKQANIEVAELKNE